MCSSAAQAQVDVIYNPGSGNLRLFSEARSVTTFEAQSAGSLFIPKNVAPNVIFPPFDALTPDRLFKISAGAGAYHSIDFGNIFTRNLTLNGISADLSIHGSLTPDGSGDNSLYAGGLDIVMSFSDDDDGLLDVMELPGFPSPDFREHRVEDLDGLNGITGTADRDRMMLRGNNLSIESGDFEGFPNLEELTLGSIWSDTPFG